MRFHLRPNKGFGQCGSVYEEDCPFQIGHFATSTEAHAADVERQRWRADTTRKMNDKAQGGRLKIRKKDEDPLVVGDDYARVSASFVVRIVRVGDKGCLK